MSLTRVGFLKCAGRQRLSSLCFAQGQALSAAKDLPPGQAQILRCAQDDTSHLAGSFPKKPTRVSLVGARPHDVPLDAPPCSACPITDGHRIRASAFGDASQRKGPPCPSQPALPLPYYDILIPDSIVLWRFRPSICGGTMGRCSFSSA